MPRLTNAERERAVGRLEAGQSGSAVARTLRCSRQTIHNLRTRVQQTGAVANCLRPGHPLVTSRREDRQIRLRHLRNRFETAAFTSRHLFRGRVSPSTISVVFSDESRFTLRFADGRVRVWRRPRERYAQCCSGG